MSQDADTERPIDLVAEALRKWWPKHSEGDVSIGPRWIEAIADVALQASWKCFAAHYGFVPEETFGWLMCDEGCDSPEGHAAHNDGPDAGGTMEP